MIYDHRQICVTVYTLDLSITLTFCKIWERSLVHQYNAISEKWNKVGDLKPTPGLLQTSMSRIFSLFLSSKNRGKPASRARETTPGGKETIRWEVVASAPGLTSATIVGGRLEAEGIPVRTWQEGAGRALGLTVGILGTAYVAVPEAYVDRARQILDEVDDLSDEESEDIVDDDTVN
jgi:hypothetical protein